MRKQLIWLMVTAALLVVASIVYVVWPHRTGPPPPPPTGVQDEEVSADSLRSYLVLEIPVREGGFPVKDCPFRPELQGVIAACTYAHPKVREAAIELARAKPGPLNLAQVCRIFDHLQRKWHYVNDPASAEVLTPAWQTLQSGYAGDCDDFANLTAAMLMAIGADCSVDFIYRADTGHAYAEVNLGNTDRGEILRFLCKHYRLSPEVLQLQMRTDLDGQHWLPLDMNAAHAGYVSLQADRCTRFYPAHRSCDFTGL
jgi:transglutaminase-like putative cysteine protease